MGETVMSSVAFLTERNEGIGFEYTHCVAVAEHTTPTTVGGVVDCYTPSVSWSDVGLGCLTHAYEFGVRTSIA